MKHWCTNVYKNISIPVVSDYTNYLNHFSLYIMYADIEATILEVIASVKLDYCFKIYHIYILNETGKSKY